MRRAIELAANGRFSTSPNPNVGCVIVSQHQRIIGEGFHQYAGGPHAEVNALAGAGDQARGATVYVTLEPCSHFGRTPPCADALIQAGVSRVVVGMQDPNPQVSGQGIRRLQQQGIDVTVDVLPEAAANLNRGFIKRMHTQRPWVTVKLAASLDGRTALANGKSQWITGSSARMDVQHHRAQSCAILSGADTVLTDNARLNVRLSPHDLSVEGFFSDAVRQPVRVIIDGQNRLHAKLSLFSEPGRCIIVNRRHNHSLDAVSSKLTPIEQWQLPANDKHISLDVLMSRLGRDFNQIWVEAGASLSGALIAQKLVDELIIYQAPKLMGHAARELVTMPGEGQAYTDMESLPSMTVDSVHRVGDDVKTVLRVASY
ncbi:bifunctional diaminohydroxyphosphoribosylaminopyrimidine deaminase/5-amino-6-(5-phosphoribosylamino)uracil reductase RibD [Alteromonas sp. SM 2104]|uniref:bifunctional diaminohydroxyphosphoribosylaminopyrimidine deaminase/5-amino-6-(5-phosphoribosylamino)uracil reductase RibD n=1 Tax=Alteromonas oceanisediminis TaxID=2836180 RepID=UPI001BDA9468|nr:bifunctional diaminohydroxyphosphoribosylaminopyrimidine deaminase/5-amino-6-(5-phosphoribosylamino)uracil reductase RibD [Alteromonas oceanisediminis]